MISHGFMLQIIYTTVLRVKRLSNLTLGVRLFYRLTRKTRGLKTKVLLPPPLVILVDFGNSLRSIWFICCKRRCRFNPFTTSVPDECYSNRLTTSVPDECYSNRLATRYLMNVIPIVWPREYLMNVIPIVWPRGTWWMLFQSFDHENTWWMLFQSFDHESTWWMLFQSFDHERIRWMLFQKRIVHTELDIYAFI